MKGIRLQQSRKIMCEFCDKKTPKCPAAPSLPHLPALVANKLHRYPARPSKNKYETQVSNRQFEKATAQVYASHPPLLYQRRNIARPLMSLPTAPGTSPCACGRLGVNFLLHPSRASVPFFSERPLCCALIYLLPRLLPFCHFAWIALHDSLLMCGS